LASGKAVPVTTITDAGGGGGSASATRNSWI
jgi:hypothetical protein